MHGEDFLQVGSEFTCGIDRESNEHRRIMNRAKVAFDRISIWDRGVGDQDEGADAPDFTDSDDESQQNIVEANEGVESNDTGAKIIKTDEALNRSEMNRISS